MRALKNQVHWVIALFGGMCLVAAAVTVADRPDIEPPISVSNTQELSTAFRRVSKQTLPSVVTIATAGAVREIDDETLKRIPEEFRDLFKGRRRLPPRAGMGSGFIIDKSGIIVTNNHVIADAKQIVVRLHDGREFEAFDVKTDPRTDIAILRIEVAEDLPEIRFGDSDKSHIGDWVLAIGNPFNQELTVTAGIISAKGRGPRITEREDFIQTDAAINPGNSGGPLLNLNGHVIGINTAISSRTGGYDGIGFAVPSNMAYWVVKQLIDHGEVRRAYLGVSIIEMTNELARERGLKVREGVIVKDIIPNSPAQEAGLEREDVIFKLNDKPVNNPRQLQGIVEQLDVDKKYTVEIQRNGSRMTLSIPMRAMPQNYSLTRVPNFETNDAPTEPPKKETANTNRFGFSVEKITPAIAKAVGTDKGVVVSTVDNQGAAFRVLAPGDVIQRVGSAVVHTVDEFNAAMEQADKQTLALLIRDREKSRLVVLRIER
jgi:serine protease Do